MKSAAEPQIIGALTVIFVFLDISAIFRGSIEDFIRDWLHSKTAFWGNLKTHEGTQPRMKSAAEPK